MMNLQPSASTRNSNSYEMLDYEIQRWIWEQKWETLHDIQEYAIPKILNQKDVIIAASTAAGKTEAAFFPILTKLIQLAKKSPTALYISPLKALINDQWERLDLLCDKLNIKVTPWHGDISATQKRNFIKKPSGCVLITPESLESLFMNHGYQIGTLFNNLQYCVIDEVHSFLSSERGKQLQCLLHRLDIAIGRKVPRVGLSATIGDLKLAAQYLRHDAPDEVSIIHSSSNRNELKIALYGYKLGTDINEKDISFDGYIEFIAKKLFTDLRGSNNLIFPNSRQRVEVLADKLRRLCEENNFPNEFWPHHGNLSKHIREEVEEALKEKNRPASAICTSTLELGIDIGSVKSVAQIGSPPSVSSLRQRLGRSGRRQGEPAILRAFNIEAELGNQPTISDCLREQLVQSISIIELLLENWCEPIGQKGMKLSTFIQQLLSSIVQYGGISVGNGWKLFCESNLFPDITKQDYLSLLTHLGKKTIIMQDHTGLLLLGELGEKFVNHYSFYASFSTDEEFKLICEGKLLGTIPIKRGLQLDTYLIFAGKRWQICSVEEKQKTIVVIPAKGGTPPLFSGEGMRIDKEIRKKMKEILLSEDTILFLDETSSTLLSEARFYYQQLNIVNQTFLQQGKNILIFLWESDDVQDTLTLYFSFKGYKSLNHGLFISVEAESMDIVKNELFEFMQSTQDLSFQLSKFVENKEIEKWDWLLPDDLLCKNYASQYLDIEKSKEAIKSFNSLT